MDAKQFFDLVSQMREAQKMYFKTRYSDWLQKSKALEKRIDAEISRVNKIKEGKMNPQLFE